MIEHESISVDASEAGFVEVYYVQIDDGIDMGGRLLFERGSVSAAIEMLEISLNNYEAGQIERKCGEDAFRVYESGSDWQPITNILNRRPETAVHGGLTGLMLTRKAAEDLIKLLMETASGRISLERF